MHIYIYIHIYLSIYLSNLSINQSIYLSIYIYPYLSINTYLYVSLYMLSIYLSISIIFHTYTHVVDTCCGCTPLLGEAKLSPSSARGSLYRYLLYCVRIHMWWVPRDSLSIDIYYVAYVYTCGGFVWGFGVLFLSCVCVSVSGVLFSVGVCV